LVHKRIIPALANLAPRRPTSYSIETTNVALVVLEEIIGPAH
jgi:hypothetical protein